MVEMEALGELSGLNDVTKATLEMIDVLRRDIGKAEHPLSTLVSTKKRSYEDTVRSIHLQTRNRAQCPAMLSSILDL